MSIYDFQCQIPHFQVQTIISHCLITISIKTCSFAIFNSVTFFPHAISTVMLVDDNTTYGT